MPTNAFPSTTSQVDTAARFPLGYEVAVPATAAGTRANDGEQTWIYVLNDDAEWSQGHVITMDVSETSGEHERYHGILTIPMEEGTPTFLVLGVAQHTIGAAKYGFILKRGVGEVKAGAGTIPERSVTGAGTICVDDAADASGEAMGNATLVGGAIQYNCDIGFSLENAAVADGSLATCYISLP